MRTLVCVLAFLVTIIYFSFSCKALANDYSAITKMEWWSNFAVASILFIIILKITVVLLRPFRITVGSYALGAVLYTLIIGPSVTTWITAAIFLIFLSIYLLLEIIQLNNQINFSLHPLGEKKVLICSLLAMLISVALGSAYYQDSIKRNYIIPPEVKTFFYRANNEQRKNPINRATWWRKVKTDNAETNRRKSTSYDSRWRKQLKAKPKIHSNYIGNPFVFLLYFRFILLLIYSRNIHPSNILGSESHPFHSHGD